MTHVTPAERAVLDLYLTGQTMPDVCTRLGISRNTALTYLKRVRARLRAAGHAQVDNKIRLTKALEKENLWTAHSTPPIPD